MILVVGASGNLGRRVVERLVSAGLRVRASSRRPEARLAHLEGSQVEVVRMDLREPGSVHAAVEGADVVVGAAQGLTPPTRSNTIYDVDVRGNRALIDAAAAAGVRHFVLLSVAMAGPDATSRFGRAKFAAEEHLRTSGVPGTVIRPDAFMESHVLDLLGRPLRRSGRVVVLGSGRVPLGFVAADDVAAVVEQAVTASPPPAEEQRVVYVDGPERLTRLQALALLERALGREAKVRHVPPTALRLIRIAARPVNPGLSYLVDVSLDEETYPRRGAYGSGAVVHRGTRRIENVIAEWVAAGTPDVL